MHPIIHPPKTTHCSFRPSVNSSIHLHFLSKAHPPFRPPTHAKPYTCKLTMQLNPSHFAERIIIASNHSYIVYMYLENTKSYHSHTTHFNPPNPHTDVSCSPSNHLVQPDPHPLKHYFALLSPRHSNLPAAPYP